MPGIFQNGLRRVIVIVAVIFSLPTVLFAERIPVFLFAGQSNMEGLGARAEELPPSEWDRQVLFSWRAAAEDTAFTFAQGTTLQTDRFQAFGPEMGFARALLESGQVSAPIAIIKVSNGGTSLWQDWNAHYAEEKAEIDPKFLPSHGRDEYVPMWEPLIRHTRGSLQSLRDQGHDPYLAGFFWCQGESDKKSRHEYEKRFRRFMEELRVELNSPDLPVIVAETGPEEVVAAQRIVAEEFGGISLRTDDQGYSKPDGVHWDSAALLDIGRRMAESWLEISVDSP